MTPESVAAQFAYAKPGFSLLGYEEILLPAFLLSLDAVGQRKKPLPAIEEFVLYAVDGGLTTVHELSGFLGLQQSVVERAVVNHWSMDNVDYRAEASGSRKLVLTDHGRLAMRELHDVVPEAIEPAFGFDRLLWEVAPQHQQQLQQRRDHGHLRELPPRRRRSPEASELDPAHLNSLLAGQRLRLRRGGPVEEVELLAVRGVTRARKKVLPAVLLVFVGSRTPESLYSIVIDGQESRGHTVAFSELELDQSLGIGSSRPQIPWHDILPPSVIAGMLSGDETDVLYRRIGLLEQQLDAATDEGDEEFGSEAREELAAQLTDLNEALMKMATRQVPVWMLPALVGDALDANRRLLITTSSANGITINLAFLGAIERLLHRGVQVTLGLPPDWAAGGDDQVRLKRRLPGFSNDHENITIAYENGLRNVLIWDAHWAAGEFPWLAYRGLQGLRTETAVLTNVREAVDAQFAETLKTLGG